MNSTSDKTPLIAESTYPIKILQFGEGNFLRAFIGEVVHRLNQQTDFNGGIAVVQPIEKGLIAELNEQGGGYTLFLNGIKEGKEVQEKIRIENIVKTNNPYQDFTSFLELAQLPGLEFIFSNTTEAGIAFNPKDQFEDRPPQSYPAKLTRWLWERYSYFEGNTAAGLYIIPCELINYNATTLKKILFQYIELWNLEEPFKAWIENAITFCNSLVDRIVPGYPKENLAFYEDQLDYKDNLLVTAEPFFLWVIEGDLALEDKLGGAQIGLDIKIVKDLQGYRTQKVRILNGAHTALVPLSILYGHQTVSDIFTAPFTKSFLEEAVRNEIAPTLAMDKDSLRQFTEAVFDRFNNPFIKHYLASIALNSISKFKVRVLPSVLAFQEKQGQLPPHLVFSFACLLRFYKGNWKGAQLPVQDDKNTVEALEKLWATCTTTELVTRVLTEQAYWDQDLTLIPNLADQLGYILDLLDSEDIESAFNLYLSNYEL